LNARPLKHAVTCARLSGAVPRAVMAQTPIGLPPDHGRPGRGQTAPTAGAAPAGVVVPDSGVDDYRDIRANWDGQAPAHVASPDETSRQPDPRTGDGDGF